ncbi:cytochrome P450 [Actinopolymorpha alba]|uniref:cytochrome P450 n=1 Tax=Actinopolymorpha alba TaxID=533267 RepID=UPI0003A82579|nr:cytochrome P450 [Actinopolymorpha alba]
MEGTPTAGRRSGVARPVARPPGPRGSLLYAGIVARRDPTAYFEGIVRDHPRLAHLRLGREHVYVLGHPELVQELFVARGRALRKGRALERIRMLLGDGLLTSEGERHRTQRRLIQPALHGDRIAAYADDMVATARAYDTRWRDGEVLDLAREMSGLTLTVVGRALFGSDLREETARVAEALAALLGGFQRHLLPGADLLLRIPTPGRARMFAAIDRLDRLVRELIERRRAAPPGPDLLSTLLAHLDDDTQVRDEVMTLLLAGHETTATALTWTWWLLSEHPEVARWLHEELDTRLDGVPSYADLDRLPRTRAVFAEAMRLYPPSWILGRRTLTEVELDGWTLPAGSLCVASQWVLHRDGRFWAAPLEFAPRRWIGPDGRYDEAVPGQPRGAYLPFGLGARICVGLAFAWMEGVLVLATLARHWDPELAPGQKVEPLPAVTLRQKYGMRMRLRARR